MHTPTDYIIPTLSKPLGHRMSTFDVRISRSVAHRYSQLNSPAAFCNRLSNVASGMPSAMLCSTIRQSTNDSLGSDRHRSRAAMTCRFARWQVQQCTEAVQNLIGLLTRRHERALGRSLPGQGCRVRLPGRSLEGRNSHRPSPWRDRSWILFSQCMIDRILDRIIEILGLGTKRRNRSKDTLD